MKAVRVQKPEGFEGIVYEDAPDPGLRSATHSCGCAPPASPRPS
jgi:hypothetical protein